MKRHKPPNPYNRERRARLFEEQYGEHAAHVRAQGCIVRNAFVCAHPIEAAHVRSRGAGGTKRDLVGLCQHHHALQHQHGIISFAKAYGLDLEAEAARLWNECPEGCGTEGTKP